MRGILLLQLAVYAFTLWFGCYLLARDLKKVRLRYAGLGLVAYALGVGAAVLANYIPALNDLLIQWRFVPILLPSVCWLVAIWNLTPEQEPAQQTWNARTLLLLGSLIIALLIIGWLSTEIGRLALALLTVSSPLIALIKVRQAFRSDLPRQPLLLLVTATIFFLLSGALLILPLELFSDQVVLLAVSGDLLMLGGAMGYLDAFDEGTRLLPDAARSLSSAALVSLLFGGQVGLAMLLSGSQSAALLVLLFTVITTGIVLEAFTNPMQSVIDKLIFADQPALQQQREALRSVAAALPLVDDQADFARMDEAEFTRLTRRTLSHLNDLNKLAASPLTQFPLISQRVQRQGKADNQIERARELRAVLVENILHMKPYSDKDFDIGEAWRYYNVLYFPYVLGIKPYSVRLYRDLFDPAVREALDWFQEQVPERTFYNWQTTAAKLVAQQLWEQRQAVNSTPVTR